MGAVRGTLARPLESGVQGGAPSNNGFSRRIMPEGRAATHRDTTREPLGTSRKAVEVARVVTRVRG